MGSPSTATQLTPFVFYTEKITSPHHLRGSLPGMVFTPIGEYHIKKVRLRPDARPVNVGRTGHGEARPRGPADDNPYGGDSRGKLCECHHPNAPGVLASLWGFGGADPR